MSVKRTFLLALLIGVAVFLGLSLLLYIVGRVYEGLTITFGDLWPILEFGAGAGLGAFLLAWLGLLMFFGDKRADK